MRIYKEIPTITITDRKLLTKYVAAFLLGDGKLYKKPEKGTRKSNGTNAMYGLSQLAEHEDYVLWQAGILSNITSVNIFEYPEMIQSQGALAKRNYKLATKTHPFFTTLYQRTYICGKKTVSPHDLKLMDWETVAIWYMDDGYFHKASDTSYFCTDCYSFGDVLLLQKVLYERLGIMTGLAKRKLKDSYGYRIRVSRKSLDMFLTNIKPYIFPSFEYKLSSRMNDSSEQYVTEQEDDEIVWSSSEDGEIGRNDLSLVEILE